MITIEIPPNIQTKILRLAGFEHFGWLCPFVASIRCEKNLSSVFNTSTFSIRILHVNGEGPRSDSFNGYGFAFGKLLWRSVKLLISDGATSSSGEEVICHFFSSVAAAVVPEAGDGCWCQAQRCSAIFSVLSCRSLRDLYFVIYDMNDTRITMQKI